MKAPTHRWALLGALSAVAILAGIASPLVRSEVPTSGCFGCSSDISFASSATQAPCLQLVELSEPGSYQYLVLRGGSAVRGKLLGETSSSDLGVYAPPNHIPAAGIESVKVMIGNEVVGTVHFRIPTPLAVPAGPLQEAATEAAQSQNVTPPLPLPEWLTSPQQVVPWTDVEPTQTQTYGGVTYAVVPLQGTPNDVPPEQSEELVPPDPTVTVLIRSSSGQVPQQKGKACRIREDQEGKACTSSTPTSYCREDTMPIGPIKDVSTSVTLGPVTIPVVYYMQPWKRVAKCDVYKCVDGKLKYQYSQKCVRLGGRGWMFQPSVVPGGGQLVQVLLGFDPTGWMWEAHPTCTRIR